MPDLQWYGQGVGMNGEKSECKMTSGEGVRLEKYIDTRLADLETLRRASTVTMEKRLDGMNEFRAALDDTQNKSIYRDEFNAVMGGIDKDIRTLRESKAMLEGKASQQSLNITTLVAVAGLVVAGIGSIISFLALMITILHILTII
jgi:hypothetical protein